jgi:hypothetical protein
MSLRAVFRSETGAEVAKAFVLTRGNPELFTLARLRLWIPAGPSSF